MSPPSVSGTVRCVGAVVHAPDGRLLLVQRGREPAVGQWSIPGGKVEPDESDIAAVHREVLEETGLDVVVGTLVGTVTRPAPGGAVFEIHDYLCTAEAGTLQPGDDAADARWCTSADLAALPLVEGLVEALGEWDCLPRR